MGAVAAGQVVIFEPDSSGSNFRNHGNKFQNIHHNRRGLQKLYNTHAEDIAIDE